MKVLPNAEQTMHVTFSLFPSEISSIRRSAGVFGSVGRAVQVAVEVLYDRAVHHKENGLIDTEENGPPPEVEEAFYENPKTYLQRQKELKAPMSCDLLPRIERLIRELAKPTYYGDRYGVLLAVCRWLVDAHADEQEARIKEKMEQEDLKLDSRTRRSMKKLRSAYL